MKALNLKTKTNSIVCVYLWWCSFLVVSDNNIIKNVYDLDFNFYEILLRISSIYFEVIYIFFFFIKKKKGQQ